MQATKELWGKTDGRTYKHYVQSYHEDEEITPEQLTRTLSSWQSIQRHGKGMKF